MVIIPVNLNSNCKLNIISIHVFGNNLFCNTYSYLHNEDFLIIYIDTTRIKIISLEKKITTLLINDDGTFENKKIIGISLLSSSIEQGYQ